VNATTVIDSVGLPVKLLIDVGNSDAIWLFQDVSNKIKHVPNNFDDYLGKGFSGDVEGKERELLKFLFQILNFPNLVALTLVL
jgi:hypothetical protein